MHLELKVTLLQISIPTFSEGLQRLITNAPNDPPLNSCTPKYHQCMEPYFFNKYTKKLVYQPHKSAQNIGQTSITYNSDRSSLILMVVLYSFLGPI